MATVGVKGLIRAEPLDYELPGSWDGEVELLVVFQPLPLGVSFSSSGPNIAPLQLVVHSKFMIFKNTTNDASSRIHSR